MYKQQHYTLQQQFSYPRSLLKKKKKKNEKNILKYKEKKKTQRCILSFQFIFIFILLYYNYKKIHFFIKVVGVSKAIEEDVFASEKIFYL